MRVQVPGVLVAVLALVAGCGGQPPARPDAAASGSPVPTAPADARGQLAARVAAARDNRYIAQYTLTVGSAAPRTVTVTIAMDGSWLVGIPGAALGGTTDIAIADLTAGLFQCAVGGTSPGCVRVAAPNGRLPAPADPGVEHLFTDWLSVLTDRQVAISVDTAAALSGSRGQCYAIEPSAASIAAPVAAGIYCYDANGTLTAAALALGTLILSGTPAAAPPTIALPAPVVSRDPLPITAPPSPTPQPH